MRTRYMKNIDDTLYSKKRLRMFFSTLIHTPIHGGALRKLRIIFLFIAFALPLVPGAASAQDSLRLDAALYYNCTLLDSLHLKLLDLEIAKAELEVRQTSFWHRLTPQIHATASFGINDLFFVDPATFITYTLPKDAYRLTLSFSLNEIFNFGKHTEAELNLEKALTTYHTAKEKHNLLINTLHQQEITLNKLIVLAEDEFSMKEAIVRFNDLRFQQGKIEYDVLVNSKLDMLQVKRTLLQLVQQKNDIQTKLTHGVFP